MKFIFYICFVLIAPLLGTTISYAEDTGARPTTGPNGVGGGPSGIGPLTSTPVQTPNPSPGESPTPKPSASPGPTVAPGITPNASPQPNPSAASRTLTNP